MDDVLNFNFLLKYIVIGDSSVGKSNILLKYTNEKLGDKIYRLQIWDTAGQETFRSITRSYYKNSVCACVVYDITKKQSFDNIKGWIEDCKKHSPKTIFLVLIGNKLI